MKIGISGCLGFFNCRYDGSGFNDYDLAGLETYLKERYQTDYIEFIPVCPEQLGGLTTPRVPAEITGGKATEVISGKAKVITREGKDVSDAFLRGAKEVSALAEKVSIRVFVLKENSPSCGSKKVYSGSFNGKLIPGMGITSAFLRQKSIEILPDNCIE